MADHDDQSQSSQRGELTAAASPPAEGRPAPPAAAYLRASTPTATLERERDGNAAAKREREPLDLGTIIVLESSPGLRRQLCEALESRGGRVFSVARLPDLLEPGDSAGAWRLAQEYREACPDVLVTNAAMLRTSARTFIRWMRGDPQASQMRLALMGDADKLPWLRLRAIDLSLPYPPDAEALPNELGAARVPATGAVALTGAELVRAELLELIRLATASASVAGPPRVLLLGCVMAARAAHVLQTQRGEVGEFLRARLAEKTLCFHVNDRMLLAVVSGQSLEQVEYAMEDWVPDGWLPIPTRASESAMQWGAVLLDPMRDAGATLSELEARLNAPWIRMRLGP